MTTLQHLQDRLAEQSDMRIHRVSPEMAERQWVISLTVVIGLAAGVGLMTVASLIG